MRYVLLVIAVGNLIVAGLSPRPRPFFVESSGLLNDLPCDVRFASAEPPGYSHLDPTRDQSPPLTSVSTRRRFGSVPEKSTAASGEASPRWRMPSNASVYARPVRSGR